MAKKNVKKLLNDIDRYQTKLDLRVDQYYAEHRQGKKDAITKDMQQFDLYSIIQSAAQIGLEYGKNKQLDSWDLEQLIYHNPLQLSIKTLGRLEYDRDSDRSPANSLRDLLRRQRRGF